MESWNGLVGDAASGPLHPGRGAAVVAATRPIPRRDRAASRARGVPAGPPAAALDLARAARVGVHAAPGAAEARPAGRERYATAAILRESVTSASD